MQKGFCAEKTTEPLYSDSSDSLKLSPNPTAKLCLPPSLPQQAHDLSGRPFVCSLSCLSLGRWVAGPWSPCSATCEKGIQHREVTCVYQLQNGTHVATRPLYCPVPRPSPVQSCEGQDCLSIWEASEWSQVRAWAALGPCLQGPQWPLSLRAVCDTSPGISSPDPASSKPCSGSHTLKFHLMFQQVQKTMDSVFLLTYITILFGLFAVRILL